MQISFIWRFFKEVTMKELKEVLPVRILNFRQQKLILDDQSVNGLYGEEIWCLQNLLQGKLENGPRGQNQKRPHARLCSIPEHVTVLQHHWCSISSDFGPTTGPQHQCTCYTWKSDAIILLFFSILYIILQVSFLFMWIFSITSQQRIKFTCSLPVLKKPGNWSAWHFSCKYFILL